MKMICPICKLELKDSMVVLGLTEAGVKKFHLQNAHIHNFLHDLVEFVSDISFHHQVLQNKITTLEIGNRSVELNNYANEIKHAETEKWEGES